VIEYKLHIDRPVGLQGCPGRLILVALPVLARAAVMSTHDVRDPARDHANRLSRHQHRLLQRSTQDMKLIRNLLLVALLLPPRAN
jgi:hypothetical protein